MHYFVIALQLWINATLFAICRSPFSSTQNGTCHGAPFSKKRFQAAKLIARAREGEEREREREKERERKRERERERERKREKKRLSLSPPWVMSPYSAAENMATGENAGNNASGRGGDAPTWKSPGGLVTFNTKKIKQKIRVRKLVSLNKHVGLAAGFDVTCSTGQVKPCGQLVFKLPVVKNENFEAFNLNVSDQRVSLTGRFQLPLGVLSMKGHGRLGLNYNGRKPYIGVDVIPTRAPTLAIGATTALYAGKKLSSSPHIKLTNNVGLDLGVEVKKETEGPLAISLDDVSLSIKM